MGTATDTTAVATTTVKVILKGIGRVSDRGSGSLRQFWKQERTFPVAADGTAEVSFTELEKGPVSAQIQVNGGKIYNLDRFHGSEDLKDGVNAMYVNPTASGLKQDIIAQVIENVLKSTDTVKVMPEDLKGQVASRMLSNASGTSDEKGAVTGLTNYLVKTYRPSTLVGLYITDDSARLLATPSTGAAWSRLPTEFWAGMSFWTYPLTDFRFRDVVRQGVDGFAYVSGDNSFAHERFIVSKLDPVTGVRKGTFINRGECFPSLTLGDQSLIIGGTNKDLNNVPVLFRWDGENDAKSRVTLGETDDPKLKWARYFTDLPGGETVVYNGVINVAFDDAKTLVCSIFDTVSAQRKYFKVDVDTGAIIGQPMTISSNRPPVVSILSPAPNAVFTQGEAIPISVDVRDDDGGKITRVAYYADGEFLGNALAGPWGYSWNTAYPGSHTITAKAVDNAGAVRLSVPVPISVKGAITSTTRIKSVHMSLGNFAVALAEDGSVWAWGQNEECSAGADIDTLVVSTPHRINLAGPARDVVVGQRDTTVVLTDGSVWRWGNWDEGVPPRTTTPNPIRRREVIFDTSSGANVWYYGADMTLAAGEHFLNSQVIRKADGTIRPLEPGASNWAAFSGLQVARFGNMWALTDDGYVYENGVKLTTISGVTALFGDFSKIARTSDGATWVWGSNGGGQLGDATTIDRRNPTRNSRLDGFTTFAMGYASLGLKADGTVWTWGGVTVPQQVPLLTDVVSIAAARNAMYAIKRDGSVLGWVRTQSR